MARCRICDIQIGCKSSPPSVNIIKVKLRYEDRGRLNYEYYCENCYARTCIDLEKLKNDFGSRAGEKGEQQTADKNLDEAIEFLRSWSFVPGEQCKGSGTRDVNICTADGSQFLAHGLVLRNSSDVFRSMLEDVDPIGNETRVVLIQEEVGGQSVKSFLESLYTGQLSDEDMLLNYRELVKLAHLYQVKLLLLGLDKFISKHVLARDTVVEIVKIAYFYQLQTTKEVALALIVDYPDHELLDIVFKELRAFCPLMAYQLLKDMDSLEYFITLDIHR